LSIHFCNTFRDAPALSTGQEAGIAGLSISSATNQSAAQAGENDKNSGEQWDDEALAATLTRKTPASLGSGTTSELMDMRSLDPKRNEQDNIAEKLRVEENKAKLAAAREGMEREAQRIKEEQEKKEAATAANPRFGAAAATMGAGGTGGKWVPPHMRAGGSGSLPKIRMGSTGGTVSQKVDTQDAMSFPDLAAADAIIEQQQKQQQPVFKVAKKTPVGGGASWASKSKSENKTDPPKEAAPAPAPSPPAAASPEKTKAPQATDTPAAAKAVTKPLAKKKKKKDLSTFKG